MAAAWALADRAADVTVLESRRSLGGRAGSFADPRTTRDVDYCQHVAMGCCTNFLWWMRQTELLQHFRRETRLTFLAPGAPPSTFAATPWLPAPLHRTTALDQLRFLSRGRRAEVRRALWRLMRTPPHSTPGTMGDWLRQQGQSDEAIERFWDVILVSALGEVARHAAFAPARMVLIEGFVAAPRASDVWIPQRPLADLFGVRLAGNLQQRGVLLRTGVPVRSIQQSGAGGFQIHTPGDSAAFDRVVLATACFALPRLLGGTPLQHAVDNLPALGKLPAAAISGLHLWFDRPLSELRHCVLLDGLAQWLFRPDFGSVQAAEAFEHYHQVVVSGSHSLRGMPDEQILATVLEELKRHFPAARQARLLRHRLVNDPRAVFSIRPEVEALRPPTETGVEGLVLAGDYTQTGWPATMEGAVLSGFRAADVVARSLAFQPVPIQSPLRRGRLARWLIE